MRTNNLMQRYRVLEVPIKLYYGAYGRCEKTHY